MGIFRTAATRNQRRRRLTIRAVGLALTGLFVANLAMASVALCAASPAHEHGSTTHDHNCVRFCPMRSLSAEPCPMHADHEAGVCTCDRLGGDEVAAGVAPPTLPVLPSRQLMIPEPPIVDAPEESPDLYQAPPRPVLLRPPTS